MPLPPLEICADHPLAPVGSDSSQKPPAPRPPLAPGTTKFAGSYAPAFALPRDRILTPLITDPKQLEELAADLWQVEKMLAVSSAKAAKYWLRPMTGEVPASWVCRRHSPARRNLTHTHPCRQRAWSRRSRHAMRLTDFEWTASSSTNSTFVSGGWGRTTLETKKCFSLATGCTAVHLVSSSFFGWTWFIGSYLATGKSRSDFEREVIEAAMRSVFSAVERVPPDARGEPRSLVDAFLADPYDKDIIARLRAMLWGARLPDHCPLRA